MKYKIKDYLYSTEHLFKNKNYQFVIEFKKPHDYEFWDFYFDWKSENVFYFEIPWLVLYLTSDEELC